jgi:MSHA pilin protein MshA
MQMKQTGSLRRTAQAGFTLIELIVVIVILGILAATALPKFADLGVDARIAKANGARGAAGSAVGISRGKWLVKGSPSTAQTIDGVTMNSTGYPTADSAGIGIAAGLTTDDYTFTPGSPTTTTKISVDSTRTDCGFTYDETTGLVTANATSTTCK